jgi:hypothetical protein
MQLSVLFLSLILYEICTYVIFLQAIESSFSGCKTTILIDETTLTIVVNRQYLHWSFRTFLGEKHLVKSLLISILFINLNNFTGSVRTFLEEKVPLYYAKWGGDRLEKFPFFNFS